MSLVNFLTLRKEHKMFNGKYIYKITVPQNISKKDREHKTKRTTIKQQINIVDNHRQSHKNDVWLFEQNESNLQLSNATGQ